MFIGMLLFFVVILSPIYVTIIIVLVNKKNNKKELERQQELSHDIKHLKNKPISELTINEKEFLKENGIII